MNIPKSIKVGGHTYSVELTKTKDTEKGKHHWGITYLEEKRILLDKEMPVTQIEETFLHEILHICMHQSRISYDIEDKIELSEEQIVMRLTIPLYQILKENNLLTTSTPKK